MRHSDAERGVVWGNWCICVDKGSDIVSINRWFSKKLKHRGSLWWVCVDYNAAALHILQPGNLPQGFSSSLLCYSPLIIRMDSVSLLTSALPSFLLLRQKRGGLVNKASLGLLFFSTPSLALFPLSFLKSLRCSPSWADCTVLQGSEGFPIFCFCFFFSFFPFCAQEAQATPATTQQVEQ